MAVRSAPKPQMCRSWTFETPGMRWSCAATAARSMFPGTVLSSVFKPCKGRQSEELQGEAIRGQGRSHSTDRAHYADGGEDDEDRKKEGADRVGNVGVGNRPDYGSLRTCSRAGGVNAEAALEASPYSDPHGTSTRQVPPPSSPQS
jgi:hypothetical protein